MDLSQAEPFVGSAGSSRSFYGRSGRSGRSILSRRFGVADDEREPLAPLGCYIYIALHFMDLSQAEPFVGSAGSSRGF